ncbi:putative transmembrane protein [Toxoplasma gondii RUB]|uniref:Putative transmembrane protein n=1 Tax=Toxoplasma gondii RUB TaxID=935652 RepID=A0A086LVN2_TOXGO|nr:putative transmembrane protein [Toxoplasma gondii RUB]
MADSLALRVSPVSSERPPLPRGSADDVSCYFLRLTGEPTPPEPWQESSTLQVTFILVTIACVAEIMARQTRIGAALSSSLTAFLTAATISNAFPWLLPTQSPVYDAAWHFLVPLILVLLVTSVVLDTSARTCQEAGDPRTPACGTSHEEYPQNSVAVTSWLDEHVATGCMHTRSSSSSAANRACFLHQAPSVVRSSGSGASPSQSVSLPPPLSLGSRGSGTTETKTGSARRFHTVGVAFVLGAVATILSVVGTYHLTIHVISSYAWCLGVSYVTHHIAAMCAACVAATYIGGSINFYAVAKTLGVPGHIVGGLGAADLFLSGLYTAILALLARHFPCLHQIFPDCLPGPLHRRRPHRIDTSKEDFDAVPPSTVSLSLSQAHPSPPLRVAGVVFCASYAAAVVALTYGLKLTLSIITPVILQGADTLGVSLVAFGCAQLGKKGLRQNHYRGSETSRTGLEDRKNFFELAEEATRVSGDFANTAQALLFAAIGSGTRLADVATIGPAIFGFTLASLVGHLLVHLILCQLFNSFARLKNPLYSIPLDDCLVASEANIGGPGTAATLAGTMLRRPDLIMPAVVWGTVGYLVATSIGIELFSFLTVS